MRKGKNFFTLVDNKLIPNEYPHWFIRTNCSQVIIVNSETIKALNDLRDCMYKFPEILVTEGIVYRGTRVPFKVIFDNINNFRENQIPYTYKAKSILQSWSEDFGRNCQD